MVVMLRGLLLLSLDSESRFCLRAIFRGALNKSVLIKSPKMSGLFFRSNNSCLILLTKLLVCNLV